MNRPVSRYEIGCMAAIALSVVAATIFCITGAMHLWNALAHLPWLHETFAMSRLTFLIWTLVVWIVARVALRAKLREGARA